MTRVMRLFRDIRAVAAVEFALTCPIMLLFFGGAVDFGLAEYAKSCVANAVTAGAEYVAVTGTSVTNANIRTLVTNESGLSGITVTVTGPACYCAGGTALSNPPTSPIPCSSSSSPPNCGTPCSVNGVSGINGTYVQITASYTYNAMLPTYSMLTSAAISQSATAPLQCS